MFNSKNYSDKLPKAIRQPLTQFAGNDCLLVSKWTDDLGLENRDGNCHKNVKGYIDAFGGEMINGWLLNRNKQFMKAGLWIWSFHSVWLTGDNNLLDVTNSTNYETNSFTTFLPDSTRKVDLAEGINYNNIVIFDNDLFAKFYGSNIGKEIKAGEVYWATEGIQSIKKLNEHSGQYRLLRSEYQNNYSILNQKYGITIVDNKIINTDSANDNLSVDILFDFSLSYAA